MNRFSVLAAAIFTCTSAEVFAQQPSLRPGGLQGFVTLSGRVTGSAGGGVFVIAAPQGRITVVATGATIRRQSEITAVTVIRPGAFVRVSGTLTGSRLVAQTVDILSLPGANGRIPNSNRPSTRIRQTRPITTRPGVVVRPGVRQGQPVSRPAAAPPRTITRPPTARTTNQTTVRPGVRRTTPQPNKQNPRG